MRTFGLLENWVLQMKVVGSEFMISPAWANGQKWGKIIESKVPDSLRRHIAAKTRHRIGSVLFEMFRISVLIHSKESGS